MTDTYGQKSLGSLKNADPLGSFSKMCLGLFPILTPSLKTWKEKLTPGGRILFRLVQSTRHIKGKGYGLLPTVTVSDATSGAIIGKNDTFKMTGNGTLRRYNQNGHNSSLSLGRLCKLKGGSRLTPTLAELMMGYPIGWTELNP